MTLRLARRMGMNGAELTNLYRGALLHDIGKMGIPDTILLKPGPLNHDEWQIMRRHPDYAYDLLSPIPYLRPAIDIPYCHHEKWDGTGYPRGSARRADPHGGAAVRRGRHLGRPALGSPLSQGLAGRSSGRSSPVTCRHSP